MEGWEREGGWMEGGMVWRERGATVERTFTDKIFLNSVVVTMEMGVAMWMPTV